MGIIVSYLNGQPNEPCPVTGLTPKEKLLVENSWNIVKKDLVGNGIQLFMVYFKQFPEYQKMFPFRDVPIAELPTNKKLKGHGTNVMYALSAVIDNLNNTDVLIDLLEKNGETHSKRNVPEKAYWDLKISVLELLQTGLGSKFTKDTKDAWDKTLTVAFTVITKTLKENQP